jgi:hypothetical protein
MLVTGLINVIKKKKEMTKIFFCISIVAGLCLYTMDNKSYIFYAACLIVLNSVLLLNEFKKDIINELKK